MGVKDVLDRVSKKVGVCWRLARRLERDSAIASGVCSEEFFDGK